VSASAAASSPNAICALRLGTAQTRIGVSPARRTFEPSSAPTISATRYVESGGVSAKCVVADAPLRWRRRTGAFEIVCSPAGAVTESWKRALRSGSSKQGKKRRASAASNCVTAY
jgi:hypothetical protein